VAALLPAPQPHDPAASSPVTPADIESLVASVSGSVIRPDDAAYDEARHIHNTLIDRKPSLIVRAADAADVARAVTFAADHGLELAVRAGGHSIHSATDGGLVVDLTQMKGLHIDPERRLAWAQPGLTAGEYTAAAAAHGLATPFGDTGSVGLAGLTLGGWDRLARPQARPHDRQPRVRRARHGRRPDRHRERAAQSRSLLGGPRRRRQLRRRDPVRLPAPSGRHDPGWRAVPAGDPRGPRGLVAAGENAPEELTTIAFIMATPPLPFVPASSTSSRQSS
jgi:hypothetical protein